jgi:dihydroorotate dehydrogenase
MVYTWLRKVLFTFPPEAAHHLSMQLLQQACGIPAIRRKIVQQYSCIDDSLKKNVFGLTFRNPLGLGAGFDKNASYLRELETLGFGFVEIGTVTPLPQNGNKKPRLFRLPKDKALINRMGFNNDGVKIISKKLKNYKKKNPGSGMLIGGNIGKNKNTPNEEAWKDYEKCFVKLHDDVDFFVVNVSSPNTPGLRALQEKDSLKKILVHLQNLNAKFHVQKPILLKIAPDLSIDQTDDIISLVIEIKLDGLVATNTTISRKNLQTSAGVLATTGNGGLSGKPLQLMSSQILEYIYKKTSGAIPIIGSGGIFTGPDALAKMKSGASLVEVWTGFIYEGPMIIKNICRILKANTE